MSNKVYYNFVINEANHTFSISATPNKPRSEGLALESLTKIEEILQRVQKGQLRYGSKNSTLEAAVPLLRQYADQIQRDFFVKADGVYFKRICRIASKKQAVLDVRNRIVAIIPTISLKPSNQAQQPSASSQANQQNSKLFMEEQDDELEIPDFLSPRANAKPAVSSPARPAIGAKPAQQAQNSARLPPELEEFDSLFEPQSKPQAKASPVKAPSPAIQPKPVKKEAQPFFKPWMAAQQDFHVFDSPKGSNPNVGQSAYADRQAKSYQESFDSDFWRPVLPHAQAARPKVAASDRPSNYVNMDYDGNCAINAILHQASQLRNLPANFPMTREGLREIVGNYAFSQAKRDSAPDGEVHFTVVGSLRDVVDKEKEEHNDILVDVSFYLADGSKKELGAEYIRYLLSKPALQPEENLEILQYYSYYIQVDTKWADGSFFHYLHRLFPQVQIAIVEEFAFGNNLGYRVPTIRYTYPGGLQNPRENDCLYLFFDNGHYQSVKREFIGSLANYFA